MKKHTKFTKNNADKLLETIPQDEFEAELFSVLSIKKHVDDLKEIQSESPSADTDVKSSANMILEKFRNRQNASKK